MQQQRTKDRAERLLFDTEGTQRTHRFGAHISSTLGWYILFTNPIDGDLYG